MKPKLISGKFCLAVDVSGIAAGCWILISTGPSLKWNKTVLYRDKEDEQNTQKHLL